VSELVGGERKERVIVFLDLLGYSSILKNQEFYGWPILDDQIERAWNFITKFYSIVDEVTKGLGEEFKITGFSDSVFIVLEPLSSETLIDKNQLYMLSRILQELQGSCFEDNLPIRGGISMGFVAANRDLGSSNMNYFAGKAVEEAVNFEGSQEWVGIAFIPPDWISPEYKERYCKLLAWLDSKTPRTIVRWDVPTKKGLVNTYAITWAKPDEVRIRDFMEFEIGKHRYEDGKYRSSLRLAHKIMEKEDIDNPCQE